MLSTSTATSQPLPPGTDIGGSPKPSPPTAAPGANPTRPPFPPTNGTDPGDVLTKKCDVAILGGGAAEYYAAFQLHAQNITVCLVEKRHVLGGAVNTYKDQYTGKMVDYGVNH